MRNELELHERRRAATINAGRQTSQDKNRRQLRDKRDKQPGADEQHHDRRSNQRQVQLRVNGAIGVIVMRWRVIRM